MTLNSKCFLAIILGFAGLASAAQAGVNFNLGYSGSESNANFQEVNNQSITGGVSVDLGLYFRVGYNYRQEYSHAQGYVPIRDDKDEPVGYTAFTSLSEVQGHSGEVTAILYAGDTFVPYVFVGLVRRYIKTTINLGGETRKADPRWEDPRPSGGIGLGVRLTQRFTMRFSHAFEIGQHLVPKDPANSPDADLEKSGSVLDHYTTLSLQYSL